MKKILVYVCVYAVMLAAAPAAVAQTFPNRAVTLVVPFPPGGATDPLARMFANKISEAWGVPVIVDNKPGAGTTTGMRYVATAAPDGYTVVVATTSAGTNPALFSKLPYDTMKDFTFLSLAGVLQSVLTVNPQVPVSNVSELVAYAKARPGKLNFSSAGNGTINHLAGELFKSMVGIDVVHVPYKGSGPAVTAVMTGEVTFIFDTVFTQLPQIKAGRLKAIASAGANRIDVLPGVAAVNETYPGFSASSWIGFMGPAHMPPEVVAKWANEIARVAQMPDVKELLASKGVQAIGGSPGEFSRFLDAEIVKWQKVVDDSQIEKVD